MDRIGQLTGRRVIAMLSANHVDPTSAQRSSYSTAPPTTPSPPEPPTDGLPAADSNQR